MKTRLLVIDPQNDFCDPKSGALYVPGADADMDRLAGWIDRHGDALDAIHVTLDSHHPVDIAHPGFWRDAKGTPPTPFTTITAAAVRAGEWRTADPAGAERALGYLDALEAGGRYPHTIWPPHCLIGSPGHNVWPALFAALRRWEEARGRVVDYVLKGQNIWTEHFSAVTAEVPDPEDAATAQNRALVAALAQADRVVVAGEAGSHCVAHTVRDLADALEAVVPDARPAARLCLLTDAVSPVTGFEAHQAKFIAELGARGMQTATTAGSID